MKPYFFLFLFVTITFTSLSQIQSVQDDFEGLGPSHSPQGAEGAEHPQGPEDFDVAVRLEDRESEDVDP